ncbi:ComEC/Rec2 family competence protein [Clostridium sp. BJN0013]|uniref:ComEC/Rec2 family competence protein n=1 Tax=Clostridium sp. BJN0013 TaxID=3236840 RepID=UPI0034C68F75
MYSKYSIKRPLVFYSISLAAGCISAIIFLDSIFMVAALAVSFFIIVLLTLEIKFCIFNMLFFIFGVASFNVYFYVEVKEIIEIRVVERKDYYFIGDFKGRKIILNGKTKGLKEGQRIKVRGNFKRNAYIEEGIIGNYALEEYKACKDDIIFNIYKFKKNIYERFKKSIGESRAAMVMSLCYGETAYMSENQMEEFQKLGIIHAVSVSGFHMAIIYKTLECIFGLKIAVGISVLYVIFTGMGAATMRSFIMILIFKLSKMFLKEYDSVSSLSLSALILMAVKPYYIVNIGFGLSFLSTLGIILYNERIYRKLFKLHSKIASNISLSLSSQIFSMPYIAFTIQNFSLGFMAGNLFLIPLFSIIVILGNSALCLYFIEPVFKVISWIINLVFILEEVINIAILKFCPNIIYLKYIDGVIIIIIYISFLMCRYGYKKFKYVPAICAVLIFFQSYNFFPTITFMNNSNGEAVIMKKGFDRFFICNYDYINTQWIRNIKDNEQIEKIVTNPEKNFVYRLDEHMYLKVCDNLDTSMKIKFYNEDKEFNFLLTKYYKDHIEVFKKDNCIYIPKMKLLNKDVNKDYKKYLSNNEESVGYDIILNRLFRIK